MGVMFAWTERTVHTDRNKCETTPGWLKDSVIGADEVHLYESDDHFRNLIDCVVSRGPTAAPVEVAYRSITICHLGTMRLGRETLKWDPRTERIVGDEGAMKMLSRPYRDPWKLPEI